RWPRGRLAVSWRFSFGRAAPEAGGEALLQSPRLRRPAFSASRLRNLHAPPAVPPDHRIGGKPAVAQKDLHSLFHDGLRYTYYAERKIRANLRKLARGARSDEIKQGFQTHMEETEGQIERLQQLFEILDKP